MDRDKDKIYLYNIVAKSIYQEPIKDTQRVIDVLGYEPKDKYDLKEYRLNKEVNEFRKEITKLLNKYKISLKELDDYNGLDEYVCTYYYLKFGKRVYHLEDINEFLMNCLKD